MAKVCRIFCCIWFKAEMRRATGVDRDERRRQALRRRCAAVMPGLHDSGPVRVERDITAALSFPYQSAFSGRQRCLTGGRPHGGDQLLFRFAQPSFDDHVMMAGWCRRRRATEQEKTRQQQEELASSPAPGSSEDSVVGHSWHFSGLFLITPGVPS